MSDRPVVAVPQAVLLAASEQQLVNLLIGSLPGIYAGSRLSGTVPDKALRPALAVMLVYAGGKLVSII